MLAQCWSLSFLMGAVGGGGGSGSWRGWLLKRRMELNNEPEGHLALPFPEFSQKYDTMILSIESDE